MMSFEQSVRVRELISQEPAIEEDKPALAGWLQRVCRAAGRDLPAMGVGISLISKGTDPLPVAASNEMSALVEELQFVMGEGPCIDAYASRSPILVPDLAATAATTGRGTPPLPTSTAYAPCSPSPCRSGLPAWAPWTSIASTPGT